MIELGAPGTFDVGAVHEGCAACGGQAPQPCKLWPELFGAAALVEVKSDLMKMTISQLQRTSLRRAARRGRDSSSQCFARGFARSSLRIMPWQQHTSAVALRSCVRGAERSGAVCQNLDETVGAESLRHV